MHLQAERGPSARGRPLPAVRPSRCATRLTSATTPGPSCAPAAPSASEVLQRVAAVHAPSDTARSVAHFDVEAAHDRCAPPGFLPDTATPRGSLRPTRRSRGTPSAPALPGSGQPVPGAGGTPSEPYCAPARRPGRRPRPCGRSLAKGAACRNPARRAAANCRLRCSISRF